jgi:hypothetical protein
VRNFENYQGVVAEAVIHVHDGAFDVHGKIREDRSRIFAGDEGFAVDLAGLGFCGGEEFLSDIFLIFCENVEYGRFTLGEALEDAAVFAQRGH